ncbi:MAG: type II toxin-antitoxin system RelE/ParE family toxin [Melioribacteraceae bacterium]|nr:type II toxin-antitoxin system RelE/ParE family toxin [Melioribacteraceae bacterium]
MIKSFSDKTTEKLFIRYVVKELPFDILKTAYKKLLMINAAGNINDLRIPPGNRLEKLAGNYTNLYSMGINDKWRIIFQWFENDAYEVKIIDYH